MSKNRPHDHFVLDIFAKARGFAILHRTFHNSIGFALCRFGIEKRVAITPRKRIGLECIEIDRRSSTVKVRFDGNAISFYFDSDEQLDNLMINIFNDFVEEEYKRLDVEGKVVVDIGANVCDSSLYFFLKRAASVYAYEAFPYSSRIAARNIALNNAGRVVRIRNEAVLGRSGEVEIDPSYRNINASQVERSEGGKKVRIVTLDEIVRRHKLRDAVLKMDCEGSEYEIIQQAKTSSLRSFKQIIIEYHYGYAPLVSALKEAGFTVDYTKPRAPRLIVKSKIKKLKMGLIYAHR